MAGHIDALARIYARSLYELADKAGGRGKIEEVAGELDQVCELIRADSSFRQFLDSPIIDRSKRGAALRRMFHEHVTDLVLRFLLVLNAKGRLSHLESIGDAFDALVHEAFGRIEVDVYTPEALRPEQVRSLAKRIGEALGKEPILYTYTDPALIGGVALRIGDRLIDGSVAGRLRRMRQSLLSSGASAVRRRAGRILGEGKAS